MYRNPQGYFVEQDAWGVCTKYDTATCHHCQRIMFIAVGTDANEFFCFSCFAPICGPCKQQDRNRPTNKACSHLERRLAAYENRNAFHKALDREKEWWGETPFG
jgi:hypothetical protein